MAIASRGSTRTGVGSSVTEGMSALWTGKHVRRLSGERRTKSSHRFRRPTDRRLREQEVDLAIDVEVGVDEGAVGVDILVAG